MLFDGNRHYPNGQRRKLYRRIRLYRSALHSRRIRLTDIITWHLSHHRHRLNQLRAQPCDLFLRAYIKSWSAVQTFTKPALRSSGEVARTQPLSFLKRQGPTVASLCKLPEPTLPTLPPWRP